MTSRIRIRAALALACLLLLAPAAAARADQAYDTVASAYAQSGGHLDPCAFSQAQLEAAIRGIPPAIRNVVPALRRAMEDGVAAHQQGRCKGRAPEEATTGGAAAGSTPTVTTPPVTTPTQVATAPAVPPAAAPTTTQPPVATTPAPATAPAQPASGTAHKRDRTPLLVALVALGALVLLALLVWGVARLRGWDPTWFARMRHRWGEAGYRATSTWAEFTDWLRLGR